MSECEDHGEAEEPWMCACTKRKLTKLERQSEERREIIDKMAEAKDKWYSSNRAIAVLEKDLAAALSRAESAEATIERFIADCENLQSALAAQSALISEMREAIKGYPCSCGDGAKFVCSGCKARSILSPDIPGEATSASEPAPEPSAESKYCFDCGFCGRFSEPGKCPSCGLSQNIMSPAMALTRYEKETERYRKALEEITGYACETRGSQGCDYACSDIAEKALAPDSIAGGQPGGREGTGHE